MFTLHFNITLAPQNLRGSGVLMSWTMDMKMNETMVGELWLI